jgi:hypothetical protein
MKELYIEETERLAGLYEEQGMGEDEAQALAEANAYDAPKTHGRSATSDRHYRIHARPSQSDDYV